MIRTEHIVITASAAAANAIGTVVSTRPISGEVVQVRVRGTSLGGTCDYTLTRLADGGTVWAGLNVAGPAEYNLVVPTHMGGTTLSGTATATGYPVDDHLQLVIGSAVASATGTLSVLYRT